MSRDLKYTQVAERAVNLAQRFEAQFAKGVDGPVHYRIELSAPDGPSTAGGKQALQHIKLVPEDGGSGLVVGSCHTVKLTAEIRMYAGLEQAHVQRFRGLPFPIDARTYRALAQELAGFFTLHKFKVGFVAEAQSPVPITVPPPPERGWTWAILIAVLAVLTFAAAFIAPRLLQR